MVGWIGSLFSKEPYYANYERNLEKIVQEEKDLQEARRQQEERKVRTVHRFWYYGLTIWACSLAYAFWVQQLDEGVLSPESHAIRVAPALFLLPILAVLHILLGTLLGMGDKRAYSRLKRLQRSKKKMIEDLKEYAKFDKVLTIINQYDPESAPRMQTPPRARSKHYKEQQTKQQAQAQQKQNASMSNGQPAQQSSQTKKLAKQGESVTHRLLPLFDRFANFMGDNPGLLAELSQLKQALYEAQDRARNAETEVGRLKRELADLKGEVVDNEDLMDTLELIDSPKSLQENQLQESGVESHIGNGLDVHTQQAQDITNQQDEISQNEDQSQLEQNNQNKNTPLQITSKVSDQQLDEDVSKCNQELQ